MDKYEELFAKAGTWGNYQIIVAIIVIFTSMTLPMPLLILPMMQKEPKFDFRSSNGIIIPVNNTLTFCKETYYSEPFQDLYDKIIIDPNNIYNWAAELKIICHTRKILAMVGTVYFLASIASNLSFSKFPDMYGRRRVFLFLNLISFIALIQLLYLNHFIQLIIAAFIMGIASLNMAIGSVIISEIIDPQYSGLIMGITNAMFPLGGIINTIFIYYFSNWKLFLYFIIIIFAFAIALGFIFLKESPKWLYANQQHVQFIETLQFIAKINGTMNQIESNVTCRRKSSFGNVTSKKDEYRRHVYDVLDLVKFKSIRNLTLKNLYLWIISGFSFFGLLLNLEGLTGNIFVDALVTYSAEFIAEIGSGYASHKIGRKNTALISFILACAGSFLFCIITIYSIEIIILFISAIGIASGFNVLYIYSAELFPTNVKSLSVSVFSLFNRLAGGTIPIILTYTRKITLPISIMSLGAIFVVLSLPESLGYNPGDEVEEVKEIVYDNPPDDQELDENGEYLYFHEVFDESF